MNIRDRAAILATLPIDQRSGPLVLDDGGRPLKPGTIVNDGAATNGEVTRIDDGEGYPLVFVQWRSVDGEAEDPPEIFTALPDFDHWLANGVTVEAIYRCNEVEALDLDLEGKSIAYLIGRREEDRR